MHAGILSATLVASSRNLSGHQEPTQFIVRHGSYCSISRIRQFSQELLQWARTGREHLQQIYAAAFAITGRAPRLLG
jgi:hypothetical protein